MEALTYKSQLHISSQIYVHWQHLQFSSVQWLSHVRLFETPWTTARQAFLSITNSRSPPKPMSIELVMPSNHLILCCPLLLLLSIFPSIRVFSNETVLHNRWPKYWNFSFSISPTNEYSGLLSFRKSLLTIMENIDLFSNQRKIWTEKGKLRGKVRSEMT